MSSDSVGARVSGDSVGRVPGVIERLGGIVGADHVLVRPDDIEAFIVDWTGRYRGTGRIVVQPDSTDQVARIVDLCRQTGTAIVPQGGNTGLVGGSVPLRGEIVLSTRRLSIIGEVDRASRQVTVGAGAHLSDVHGAAQQAGLRYPIDFGARDSATIGGTIATNAGGVSVLRYGMTRRHIVGVEAVLGTGEVVSHLGGLAKDNTGYDLAGLLCGSEGTLGIVTRARVQLVPNHEKRTTALIGFTDASAAIDFVVQICSSREDIDALEFFFEEGVRLVCETFERRAPFDAPVYVLIEISADEDRSATLSEFVDGCAGIVDVAVASSENSRMKLWQLREEHTPAINTLGPPLKFDVTVPLNSLAAFLGTISTSIGNIEPAARTFLFGHAADGNVHVNVTGVDLSSPSVPVVEDAVIEDVVRFDGSVSAEHGIGTAKKRFLSHSRSPAEIEAMLSIKRALDPEGIMNPNVLFE